MSNYSFFFVFMQSQQHITVPTVRICLIARTVRAWVRAEFATWLLTVRMARTKWRTAVKKSNSSGWIFHFIAKFSFLKFEIGENSAKFLGNCDTQFFQWSTDKIPETAKCNFEHGWCGWRHRTDRSLNWTLNRGETGAIRTGPSYDHTYRNETGELLVNFIYQSTKSLQTESTKKNQNFTDIQVFWIFLS